MYVLKDYTEEEITQIILDSINILADMFKFGYYTKEDMLQEGFAYAIEALPRFSPKCKSKKKKTRELKNFLITHVKNRFINLHRTKLERREPPCQSCEHINDDLFCFKYPSKEQCKRWKSWNASNAHKKDLMKPLDNTDIRAEEAISDCPDISENLIIKELQKYIEDRIPKSFLADYHRWLNNVYIPKPRRSKIEIMIRNLGMRYYNGD